MTMDKMIITVCTYMHVGNAALMPFTASHGVLVSGSLSGFESWGVLKSSMSVHVTAKNTHVDSFNLSLFKKLSFLRKFLQKSFAVFKTGGRWFDGLGLDQTSRLRAESGERHKNFTSSTVF
jgi:hypothetical protein